MSGRRYLCLVSFEIDLEPAGSHASINLPPAARTDVADATDHRSWTHAVVAQSIRFEVT
jgi:hypothetical protein